MEMRTQSHFEMNKDQYENPQTRNDKPVIRIVLTGKNDGPTIDLVKFFVSAKTPESGKLFGYWRGVDRLIMKDGQEIDVDRFWLEAQLEDKITMVDLSGRNLIEQINALESAKKVLIEKNAE